VKRLAFVILAALALGVALGGNVDAAPGDRCWHSSECSAHEVCVADGEASSTGRCVRMKVLP
jgi:hypothetical protein